MSKHLAVCLFALILVNLNNVNCNINLLKLFQKPVNNEAASNLQFSYTNCGPVTDSFIVNSLELKPMPLVLPGTVTATGTASIKKNITAPLSVQLKIYKVVGRFKLEVPCVSNLGSCNYDDVCQFLPSSNDNCPDYFKEHNLPCSCPFSAGEYSAQNLSLDIDLDFKIPAGAYNIIANFLTNDLGHVGCLNINADIA